MEYEYAKIQEICYTVRTKNMQKNDPAVSSDGFTSGDRQVWSMISGFLSCIEYQLYNSLTRY